VRDFDIFLTGSIVLLFHNQARSASQQRQDKGLQRRRDACRAADASRNQDAEI
jgi:hypothetical protein